MYNPLDNVYFPGTGHIFGSGFSISNEKGTLQIIYLKPIKINQLLKNVITYGTGK